MAALTSYLYKIVIIGDSGVGKSSLLSVYVNGGGFQENLKATIGCDLLSRGVTVDGVDATLQIWDTAGQEKYQSLSRAFYRGSDAVVLVFDVTSEASLAGLDFWRNEFLQGAFVTDPSAFPMVVFANKVDEEEAGWEVTRDAAKAWCAKYGLPLFYTSAKDNEGLVGGFEAVARACMSSGKIDDADDGMIQVQELEPQQTKKEGCAC